MIFYPRPYQTIALERMLANDFQLLALRMGTGKTVVTLLAIDELLNRRKEITKTLIVAPKRVAELVWHTEATKWEQTKGLKIQRVLGQLKQRLAAVAISADIYVINRENFAWLVDYYGDKWPFDCVVIDENRGFKDCTTKSWKALKSVRKQIKKLYLLTGTPTPNSLLELWPQISILDQGKRLGLSLGEYRNRWFVPDKRNGYIIYSWAERRGAAKEIRELVKDIMFSTDGDIKLPERIDNIVPIQIPMDRYEAMESEMISENLMASSAGVLANKLAQMANGACYDADRNVHVIHDAKLEALAEIVEQGEPVICFTTYQHDQSRILSHFPNARIFDGEQSLKDWQAGHIDLLLMHPASGGHGVDGLQLGGSVAVWFGLPFSLDLYEQANARLHRIGQTNNVIIHHLVAVNTIDEHITKVLNSKGDIQQALLDAVNQWREEVLI